MFKEQVNPNDFQFKIEYYGENALPVVSASVHIWRWRAGWEPSYKFTKAILRERSGAQYVQIIICTNDLETALLFYRLIREGAAQYETKCDTYQLENMLGKFERMQEFHTTKQRVK